MKSVKQIPLLATVAAMVLIGISSSTDWIRIVAAIVTVAALFIFVKDNLKKK
jgi:hypothetical protein